MNKANLTLANRQRKRSRVALLIVDMLNPLDFAEGHRLLPRAERAARQIARLKSRARRAGLPVIYVNDNFGEWRTEWSSLYQRCVAEGSRGRSLALLLKPEPTDYFILKPKHSAFYCSPLDVLLEQLGVRKLIITGVAADICVLFTAQDAHVREYKIQVPRDCVASETTLQERHALALMHKSFHVETPASRTLRLR